MKIPKVSLPSVKITPLAVKSITTAYFHNYQNRPSYQGKFILEYVTKHSDTAFGRHYHLDKVNSIKSFQKAVPLQHYESIYPRIERSMYGESDVLMRGKIDRFATSSGTTGKNKYIPVSKISLKKNHFRAGTDVMMYYAKNNPETKLRQGSCLGIGGGFSYNPFTGKQNVGYISAILQKQMPILAKLRKQPSGKISYLSDWLHKVEKMIQTTRNKNITAITAQPSRGSAYLEKMIAATGAKDMFEIRPNFELVIRGGMAVDLYLPIFKRLFPGDQVHYYQAYNASEGFFAVQHENNRDDMLLLVEHGVFYEFIPFENYIRKNYSVCYTLYEVEIGKPYVIVITNSSGLRRYVLGDVVEFTGIKPHTIKITGRTKYYIDVAGECTPFMPIDESIREAASHFKGTIKEYTVGPGEMDRAHEGHYEIYIERTTNPSCSPDEFASHIDELLCKKRSYYHDERHDTHMLQKPKAIFLPTRTFYHRLENRGKLGGQHKIPKISNDRCIIEQIKEIL